MIQVVLSHNEKKEVDHIEIYIFGVIVYFKDGTRKRYIEEWVDWEELQRKGLIGTFHGKRA